MLGGSSRALAVLAVVAAVLTAGDASTRTIRRSCRDGTIAQRTDLSGRLVACDVGARCDGACAFAVPACGPDSCQTETFTVAAGTTRRERLAVSPGAAPATLVLRCRQTRACIGVGSPTITTTTTAESSTTGAPHPSGPTTTTRLRLVRASTTSSSTVVSTSSTIPATTTTLVIPTRIPCRFQTDCDGLSTACSVGFCTGNGFCAQACVCLTPDLAPTCSLVDAATCLTPGECRDGTEPDPNCRVCFLNLCATVLVPQCFPVPPGEPSPFTPDFSVTVDFGLGSTGGGVFGSSTF